MNNLIAWIVQSVVFGSVIMYGALGEMLTEKAGHLNLGTPGIMCVGGSFGFIGGFLYEKSTENPNAVLVILITLICGFAAATLVGLIYSFLTITLRVNQNVTGLTLTIFGVGVAKFFGTFVIPEGTTTVRAAFANSVFVHKIPFLSSKLGIVSKIFFSYGFMMYLVIILAIFLSYFLNKTWAGLNLRAVGENPGTADAAGVNVIKYKYFATAIGSGITGLGGVYYVLDYNNGTWATASGDSIESLAWLAVALVIFATWRPISMIWGSYLFGLCYWAYAFVPSITGINVNTDLAEMLPYIVTIVVLCISSVRSKKENQGPQSVGLAYFREER